jgi:hypothetical protein
MTIKKPSDITMETDQITRAVKGAQSFDAINDAKELLAGIRSYVEENRGEYQRAYGDGALSFIQHQITSTGVFLGLKEIEITRREQAPQLRALGYKV